MRASENCLLRCCKRGCEVGLQCHNGVLLMEQLTSTREQPPFNTALTIRTRNAAVFPEPDSSNNTDSKLVYIHTLVNYSPQ